MNTVFQAERQGMAQEVAQRVKARLKASGLSQRALARKVGCQQCDVSEACRGRKLTRLDVLRRLAGGLGCRLRDLVDPDE